MDTTRREGTMSTDKDITEKEAVINLVSFNNQWVGKFTLTLEYDQALYKVTVLDRYHPEAKGKKGLISVKATGEDVDEDTAEVVKAKAIQIINDAQAQQTKERLTIKEGIAVHNYTPYPVKVPGGMYPPVGRVRVEDGKVYGMPEPKYKTKFIVPDKARELYPLRQDLIGLSEIVCSIPYSLTEVSEKLINKAKEVRDLFTK
jgi:hypothetical protein